jgi:succinate dehydrogenase/fumarate reductase cytochrome b subunit
VVLSFCTLGLYQYYWFYKNWRIVRDRTNEQIIPFWRGFFAVFFCYSLFSRIQQYSPDLPATKLAAGPLAATWIILSLSWRLPEPYALVSFLAILVLAPVQHAINGINHALAPAHEPNARFSAWNWVAVCLGGPLFLLAVYGSFLPEG